MPTAIRAKIDGAASRRQEMIIERLQDSQAEDVSGLIKRNLLEIISNYYPSAYVAALIAEFSPANILRHARTHRVFVAIEGAEVIGTGSLADFGTAETPSYYGTAIFVTPEYHSTGVGRQLMHRIEAQAVELGADRITVRAAVNARGFYEKLGYLYRDGIAVPDERGNFVMVKGFPGEST
jgi:GNAT superfamily N-acetyltransferase